MSEQALVERLWAFAEKQMLLAECASNLGKPETDNEYGRSACSMREAATHIKAQAAEIERIQQEVISEKAGLAGERMGTIAALRHQLDDQAERIEELEQKIVSLAHARDNHKHSKQNLSVRYGKQCTELTRLREAVQLTADGEIPGLVAWFPGAVSVHRGYVLAPLVNVHLGNGQIDVAIGLCFSTAELAEEARKADLTAAKGEVA